MKLKFKQYPVPTEVTDTTRMGLIGCPDCGNYTQILKKQWDNRYPIGCGSCGRSFSVMHGELIDENSN